MMGKMKGKKSVRKSCIIVSQNQEENCAKFVWPFQNIFKISKRINNQGEANWNP